MKKRSSVTVASEISCHRVDTRGLISTLYKQSTAIVKTSSPLTLLRTLQIVKMAEKTYNVGVIGYGLSAKMFHIPFITAAPEFTLYAVVQRNPKPDDDAEKDHPGIKSYRSTEDMVGDPSVDVVVVTTTPTSHLSLAKLALNANKHVLVEKPFTPTSAEANELVDLAASKKLLLTVYQNRRFDSDYLTLSKYVKDNTLGRVVEFETHFDRHRPEVPQSDSWKYQVAPGSGAIYDLGTHLMDQVVHLFGLPSRVTAFIGSQRQGESKGFEDSCTVLLHYKDGLLATCKAGVVSPEVEQLRYWVRGEKGSFRKYHLDVQEEQLKAGMRPGDQGYGVEPKERHGILNTVQPGGKIASGIVPTVEPATYTEFYRSFARALVGEQSSLPVDPKIAAKVIRLVELAKVSSDEGRTVDV